MSISNKSTSTIAQHCVEEKLIKKVKNPQNLNRWEIYYINQSKMDLVNIAELKPINSRLFTLDNRLKRRIEPQPTRKQDRISTTSLIHDLRLDKDCPDLI